MPKTFGIIRPAPLTNRLDPADFGRGLYDPTLTGSARYNIGDLVTLRGAGGVARSNEDTTAASVERLAIAGQPWSMPKAFPYLFAKGVPLNRIDRRDEWVFTYVGEFTSTLLGHVQQGLTRDILFTATPGVLTVRNAAASATVKLLRVFEGEVGDTNVRVVVNFLESKLW